MGWVVPIRTSAFFEGVEPKNDPPIPTFSNVSLRNICGVDLKFQGPLGICFKVPVVGLETKCRKVAFHHANFWAQEFD